MAALKRVLVANRGEIAIRIIRAAHGLGMESVAVFAPVDDLALHTQVATTAVAINSPAGPVMAYLDIDALVQAALDSGCDAVHPGYGFLSENAVFASRCAAAGLVFVGPSPSALSLFGDKVQARALATSLDIAVVRGSDGALADADAAAALARDIGYPVLLKAAVGGGGRGMRIVTGDAGMAEAFARCQGEAEAAFGNGSLFLEQYIPRPRHIEVQVLADSTGQVVHLHERDCSVQLRHQKVVELAPAPNLDPALRAKMHTDAVRLVAAAGYCNAGTVEFLVDPASGGCWFIECNPRIQVEHTITEQVLGLDLVQAQLRIAGGETLADLGLADQSQVPAPRGTAIQLRVVSQGVGTLSAYKEPSGPGVRVDGHGYLGYAPPAQFDPLLAKLIVTAPAGLAAALAGVRQALAEFHIAGVPNNLTQLQAIVALPELAAGDARTTLLEEHPEVSGSRSADPSGPQKFLGNRAQLLLGAGAGAAPVGARVDLSVPDGSQGAESPMAGTVVSLLVANGERVTAGQTLLVVSAMKMETTVTAPCSGTLDDLQELTAGDSVAAGQVVAVVTPGANDLQQDAAALDPADTWQAELDEVARLKELALARLAPGSEEAGVVRQRTRGKLTCRERITELLDPGSFREVGSITGFASYDGDGNVAAFTPANHVGGTGTIDARPVVVCADDFTSRGGHSDGAIGEKSRYLDMLSNELQVPSIRLLDGSSGGGSVAAMVPKQAETTASRESSGAIQAGKPRVTGGGGSYLPGHLGSDIYSAQLAAVPVVNMLLGSVVGLGAAKAVLGHFSVMVRDMAQLFVAGPPVVSHAMGYDISKEDLGGWHIHCTNGSVDNLAETEAEAVAMTRQFLSYLPASVHDAPPVLAPDPADPVDRREDALFTLVPRQRNATFDVRKAIRLMADRDSFFELGSLWGTDQVTGFVRFNGHPMGVIASDSRHTNGGALTADGCDKLRRHLDLCDLFHLPLLNLVDNPGFAVGLEHERLGTIRKGGEWMVAFSQVQMPLFTVLMRRSFGVAGNNFATPRARPHVRVVWPAADVGGIPPEGGIEAAYKRQLAEAEDPVALRAEIDARIEAARGPVGPLNRFQMEEMIDPRDTRRLVCEWVETAYRQIRQPGRLGPRGLAFRP